MENEVKVAVIPQNTIDRIFEELANVKDLISRLSVNGLQQPIEALEEGINPENMIDSKETAKILGVSVRSVQNYRESGELGYYQIGGSVRFNREEVYDFLKRHKVNGKTSIRYGRN